MINVLEGLIGLSLLCGMAVIVLEFIMAVFMRGVDGMKEGANPSRARPSQVPALDRSPQKSVEERKQALYRHKHMSETRLPGGGWRLVWHNKGTLHCESGPAFIENLADGTLTQVYYREGKRYRQDGPAFIKTLADGTRIEEFYSDGKIHCEDGPAHIEVAADGTRTESYYRRGLPYDPAATLTPVS